MESQQIQPFDCYATASIRPHNSFDAPIICYPRLRIMKAPQVLALNREHFNGAKKVKCRKIYYIFSEQCCFFSSNIRCVWRLESLDNGLKNTLFILYYTQCYTKFVFSLNLWFMHYFIITMIIIIDDDNFQLSEMFLF